MDLVTFVHETRRYIQNTGHAVMLYFQKTRLASSLPHTTTRHCPRQDVPNENPIPGGETLTTNKPCKYLGR